MKKFLKTLWGVVWPLGLYIILSLVVELVYALILVFHQYYETGILDIDEALSVITSQTLTTTGVVNLIAITIFAFVIRSDMRTHPDAASKTSLRKVIGAVLAAIGACIAGNLVLESIGIMDDDTSFQLVNEVISNSALWIQIVVAVILAPLVEELLFRGIIYRRIDIAYGFWPAALISSLFFGLLHGNLTQGVYAFFLGMVFAYAYHKTGRLTIPVVMHVIANFVSLAVDSILMESQGNTEITLALLAANILILIIGICMLSDRKREIRE